MADPRFDPREIADLRRAIAETRAEREFIARDVGEHAAEVERLEARARRLEASGDLRASREIRRAISIEERLRRERAGNTIEIDRRLRELLERLRDRSDPCDADPSVPLVLLPVRVETRYTPDGATLRVRIYPDDLHVDGHDRGLSDSEVDAGRTYWARVLESPGGDAWATLLGAVGARRATWVATALRPTNLDAWRQGAAPAFPDTTPREKRAAIARLLPDRFVVVAEQDGERRKASGRAISPELVVGLMSDDGTEFVETDGAMTPPGGEWMVDYHQALAAGMALEVQLARPRANVDRLLVMGVRQSMEPHETIAELETLLASHRCTKGLSFIQQGAPSNNTEEDSSSWSSAPEPAEPVHLWSKPGSPDRNAKVLADALRIDERTLDGLDHGDIPEQSLASAMNVALWPSTWGTFLDRLSKPQRSGTTSISDAVMEMTRTYHRDHVRGRGPLPTLRIGDQPYGFLPTSTISTEFSARRADDVERQLYPFLMKLLPWWKDAASDVPHVGDGRPIDESILEILGAAPVSQGLRVRTVVSDDAKRVATQTDALDFDEALEDAIERIVLASIGVDSNKLNAIGSLESRSRPLPYPMVHESDGEFIVAMLQDAPVKVQSILQALLAISWDIAEREVNAASDRRRFHDLLKAATGLSDSRRARVTAIAGRAEIAPASELLKEADAIASEVGEAGPQLHKAHAPVGTVRDSIIDLVTNTTGVDAKATLASRGVVAWMRAVARKKEIREALEHLRDTTLEQRRVLFAESIDLCSHRLDAWLTGLVDRRRKTLDGEGLTVGAYAWLEDIRMGRGSKPNGGYIHAPTLDHAATAGVLRSAFLTHNPDETGDSAFAIDLGSARVRTALHLIDGMRQGQPLGALLGYRIERALHEAKLDRLILTLRGIAPLLARRLTDRDDTVQPEAVESIASNNVVDGIRLVEKYRESAASRSAIRQALADPPKDNPYIDRGDWPELTAQDWSTVERIILDAHESMDAASDLMLAESVHQLVRGNTARAAAALSAAGGGDTPPPEPEVIRAPGPAAPFTHRVLIDASGDAPSWNSTRPRALASPDLESWCATRLGRSERIVVAEDEGTRWMLSTSGLCALDLVADATDAKRVEQRLRAALPDLPGDVPLAQRTDEAWPAGFVAVGETIEHASILRQVLAQARPSRPVDFCRPNESPLRTVTDAEMDVVRSRAMDALGGLTGAVDALLASILPPDGSEPVEATVRAALEGAAAYGIVPPMIEQENLTALAEVAIADGQRRMERAIDALDTPDFDQDDANEASQAIFGDGFWMPARISAAPAGDLFITAIQGDPSPGRAEIRRFLRDVGAVRAPVSRLSTALLVGDAFGSPTVLNAAQLAIDPAPWVGGTLGADRPTPSEPISNVVVVGTRALDAASPIVAMTIDQWTDVVPIREPFGDDAEPSADSRRPSGIAINAASSSSRPPQVVLLGVAPNAERWDTDRIASMLGETLDLAKTRAVALEHVLAAGRILPALYTKAWSLQGEKVLDLRAVATSANFHAMPAFVKETT